MTRRPTAAIDRTSWTPDPIFELIADRGRVAPDEMERTFNLGVGMVVVVPESAADAALALLRERAVDAWPAGHLTSSTVTFEAE